MFCKVDFCPFCQTVAAGYSYLRLTTVDSTEIRRGLLCFNYSIDKQNVTKLSIVAFEQAHVQQLQDLEFKRCNVKVNKS